MCAEKLNGTDFCSRRSAYRQNANTSAGQFFIYAPTILSDGLAIKIGHGDNFCSVTVKRWLTTDLFLSLYVELHKFREVKKNPPCF